MSCSPINISPFKQDTLNGWSLSNMFILTLKPDLIFVPATLDLHQRTGFVCVWSCHYERTHIQETVPVETMER